MLTPTERLRAAAAASHQEAPPRRPRQPRPSVAKQPPPREFDPDLTAARAFAPPRPPARRGLESEAAMLRRELATTTHHLNRVLADLAALPA